MTPAPMVGISREFAAAVLDALPDATAVLDREGNIRAVNHAWRMFALDNDGSQQSTGTGVNHLEVCKRSAAIGCEDTATVAHGLRAVLNGDNIESELEYPCPSPAAGRWFLLRATHLAGPNPGAPVAHVNITRRKAAEEALAHEASHDPLTGLANRTLFTKRLSTALTPRRGRPIKADIGLLFIDLDKFKPVNDVHGHSAGDEVLLATAHRLRVIARPQDTVGRLGGDEFAILAPRITTVGLESLANRVTVALAEPHLVHGHTVIVAASVGTQLASAGHTAAQTLNDADQAMYAVKRRRASASLQQETLSVDPARGSLARDQALRLPSEGADEQQGRGMGGQWTATRAR
jgi:diguanylate cyclase (GGDEF)-like protein